MYKFQINNLKLNTIDGVKDFKPSRINVIIGLLTSG